MKAHALRQCKRKRHTRKLLIDAQEAGEIIAIGANREANNHWQEPDREVLSFFIFGFNGNRYTCWELIMIVSI